MLLKCVAFKIVGIRLDSPDNVSAIFHITTRLSSPPENN